MKVYTDLQNLPTFNKAVITIGTFDGVHFGHRKIIKQLVNEAKKIEGHSILITFDPHPRLVLNSNDKQLQLLSTLAEKINLLENLGINILVIVPFNLEFASQDANTYVQDFLVNKFNPHTIVIGYDHHFGKNREGNFIFLEKNKEKFNFNLIEIPSQILEEITVSSTAIRNHIATGNIPHANKLLQYHYGLQGTVIQGNQLGRTIGYPTANIKIENNLKLLPQNGVYAVQILWQNTMYNGMLNIGYKPTVQNNLDLSIEINIFDFTEEIYNEKLQIFFITKIREEQKFENIEALKKQLAVDKINCQKILSFSNA